MTTSVTSLLFLKKIIFLKNLSLFVHNRIDFYNIVLLSAWVETVSSLQLLQCCILYLC